MYITINSEFRPFTYDELTKPLNDYTEAYNKVEEQYATLAQQTEAWKNIATQENSPKAYAMYKNYSDELNKVVEDFSRGMTIQNRSKLSGLKSRYASEITPIANAYNAMQEANKYRDTVMTKDGSAVFIIDRYNSLDYFLNGNQADNTFISGDEIQKNVTARVLSQSYTDYNNLINSGIKPDKAIQIVASGNNKSIADIIAEEKSSLGIDSFDTQGQAKLNNAILAGVQQGLGSFASKEYMSKAERDASARGWSNFEESKKQHENAMISNGYKKDAKGNWVIDESSPKWKISGIYFENGEPKVGVKPGTEGNNPKEEVEKLNTKLVISPKEDGSVELKDKSNAVVYSNYKKYTEHSREIQEKIRTAYPGKSPAELGEYLFGIGKDGSIAIEEIEKETRTINENKGADNVVFGE